MSKYNEYLIEDLSYSIFNIKKLEICGNYIFEINEVIRKTRNAVEEFLNKNKDVDYLLVYYYPTQKDMENDIPLCYLLLNKDIKHNDLLELKICEKIRWNEEYDGFVKKKRHLFINFFRSLTHRINFLFKIRKIKMR